MNQAILFLSDKSSKWIINLFKPLSSIDNAHTDVFFLYHKRDNSVPDEIRQLNHYTFTNEVLTNLGYTPIEDSLVPGSNHFPLMKFYSDYPGYDYYWVIEDDVIFNGDWNYFFDSFKDNQSDFISSYLQHEMESPGWYWWNTLVTGNEVCEKKICSFNPVYRLSNQALRLIDTALKSGWKGHHEVLIPTLLAHHGLKILDMGNTGSFVEKTTTPAFYTPKTMSHLPVEVTEEKNLLFHPIKEKKEIDLNALKKYCIISAVGKDSLHREWITEESDFDLHLIIYDNSYNKFYNDTNFISYQKGYKFKLIHDYLQKHPEYLNHYEYFFVPDDDISMNPENITRLFRLMEEYQLQIAQPALTDSYYTYEHTILQEESFLRYTNFVEMMTPCFSRESIQKVLFTFNENVSGWGIEFHWSQLIGFTGKEMAIIDDLHCIHTRPIQSFNERNVTELTEYLEKYQLNREIVSFGHIVKTKADNQLPLIQQSELKDQVRKQIDEIAHLLLVSVNATPIVGLAEGRLGIALFLFQYYRLSSKRKYYDMAMSVFESVYPLLGSIATDNKLSTGLAGIGWMVEYMAQSSLTENDTDDILEEICTIMDGFNPLDQLSGGDRLNDELLLNVLQYGVHYLSRIRNSKHNPAQNSQHLTEKYILFQLIDFLETQKTYFLNESKDNNNEELLRAIVWFLSSLQKQNIVHSKLSNLTKCYAELLQKQLDLSSYSPQYLQSFCVLAQNGIFSESDIENYINMIILTDQKEDNFELLNVADSVRHLYQITGVEKYKLLAIQLYKNYVDAIQLTVLHTNLPKGVNGLAGNGLKLIGAIAYYKTDWDELGYFMQPEKIDSYSVGQLMEVAEQQ